MSLKARINEACEAHVVAIETAEVAGYNVGYYESSDDGNAYDRYSRSPHLLEAFLKGWNEGQDARYREHAVNAELYCEDGPWDVRGRL